MSTVPPVTPEQQIQQAINETKAPTPIEVRLDTGQVYKGANPQEVLDQLVRAQTEASRHITQQKAQLAEYQTQLEQLKAQQQPAQVVPAQDAAQQYLQNWATNPIETNKQEIAKAFGVTPEQLPQLVNEFKAVTSRSKVDMAAAQFQSDHPEYPNTPEANLAMKQALMERYGPSNIQNAMTDPDRLEATYQHLVRQNRIQPNQMPPQGNMAPNVPLPNMRGNSVPPQQQTTMMMDFMQMSLEDQKKTLEKLHNAGLR